MSQTVEEDANKDVSEECGYGSHDVDWSGIRAVVKVFYIFTRRTLSKVMMSEGLFIARRE
jgi:hypothetical protein